GRLFSVSHFRVPHILLLLLFINLFSFTHPSTTNHPTLSLHDALPIFCPDNRNADTHLQSQVRRVQFRNTPLEHSPQKYTPIEVASTQLVSCSKSTAPEQILQSTDCISDSENEDDDHVDSIPETQLPRLSQSSQIYRSMESVQVLLEDNPSTQYLSFNPIALERLERRSRESTPEFLRRPAIPNHLFTQILPAEDGDEEEDLSE